MTITTTHKLLTECWAGKVATFETVLGRFNADGAMKNDCDVAFFEVARDAHLHVDIVHRFQTSTEPGWAGATNLAGGFVHNRAFGAMRPSQLVRRVLEMVFASRIRQNQRAIGLGAPPQ